MINVWEAFPEDFVLSGEGSSSPGASTSGRELVRNKKLQSRPYQELRGLEMIPNGVLLESFVLKCWSGEVYFISLTDGL